MLFDPLRRRVLTLGPAEALAWCLLSEVTGGNSKPEEALSAASGRPAAEARLWLDALLAQWASAGLLDPPPALPAEATAVDTPAMALPAAMPDAPAAAHRCYRLLGLVVEVAFAEASAAAEADAVLGALRTDAPPQARAALLRDGDGAVVVTEGRLAEQAARPAQAIPALKIALTRLALSRAAGFAVVHAAAVARAGRAVLLPAPSGSGKSTLAAACALANWELIADDTVVLDAGTGGVLLHPLPLALCLKPGAWAPVTAGFGNQISGLPVYERLDGKLARYLVPPRAADGPRSLAALVVPCWRAGTVPAQLRRLTALEAFEALMPQLYPLAAPLDAAAVGRVAALVGGPLPCFALDYDRLTDGVALLAEAANVA